MIGKISSKNLKADSLGIISVKTASADNFLQNNDDCVRVKELVESGVLEANLENSMVPYTWKETTSTNDHGVYTDYLSMGSGSVYSKATQLSELITPSNNGYFRIKATLYEYGYTDTSYTNKFGIPITIAPAEFFKEITYGNNGNTHYYLENPTHGKSDFILSTNSYGFLYPVVKNKTYRYVIGNTPKFAFASTYNSLCCIVAKED